MKKKQEQTTDPIRITFCNMENNVPKIMEIAEFHPTWIGRGKFDEHTQFIFDRMIKKIMDGGYISIGKDEHGKQNANRKRKKIRSKKSS